MDISGSSDEEVNLNDSFDDDVKEYDYVFSDFFRLSLCILASQTESIVFPLSVVGYALIEYPRPSVKYFKYMMIYTEIVFFSSCKSSRGLLKVIQ